MPFKNAFCHVEKKQRLLRLFFVFPIVSPFYMPHKVISNKNTQKKHTKKPTINHIKKTNKQIKQLNSKTLVFRYGSINYGTRKR